MFYLLDNYRAKVRADLAEYYGLDLARLFAARKWQALMDYIYELPATSRTVEAQVNDPLLARQIAEHASQETTGASLREETLTNDYLRSIEYRLGEIARAIGGGKGKQIKPRPYPETELQKARKQVEQEKAENLIAQFTPWATH